MASDDDARYDESGRPAPGNRGRGESGSQGGEFGPALNDFGPPTGEFGPPTGEFGPPVNPFGAPAGDFGPPMAEFGPPGGGPGWAPADESPRPELGWQPADAPSAPPVPPPPPQYRAPDSGAPYRAPDAQYRGPENFRAPDPADTERTQRMPTSDASRMSSSETVRFNATDRADTQDARRPADAGPPKPASESRSGSLWDDDELAKKLVVRQPSTSGSGSGSGSLWDDDDLAKKLAPRPLGGPAAPPQRSKRRAWPLLAGGLAVIVVIAALAVGGFLFLHNKKSNPAPAPSAAPATPTGSAFSCPASTSGNVTIGNGPGDTRSGVGAILGFQHAFYVDRNGVQARRFVAPNATNVSTADVIQKGIDQQIPVGTAYCVAITTLSPTSYNVQITEHRPNGYTAQYLQTVTTVAENGQNLIFEITSH